GASASSSGRVQGSLRLVRRSYQRPTPPTSPSMASGGRRRRRRTRPGGAAGRC
ncbi:MAG: hypothetical protein KC933_26115, partial [Myxococcales bacterium]|nr:hypothetical protein [Myxococcales bacterium]